MTSHVGEDGCGSLANELARRNGELTRELAATQALAEFYRLSLTRADERIAELERNLVIKDASIDGLQNVCRQNNKQIAELERDRDSECICRGNWRSIVKRTEHLIGRMFRGKDGDYMFYGIVHGDDDYYYGMYRDGNSRLLSCVASIETSGFELLPIDAPRAKEEK